MDAADLRPPIPVLTGPTGVGKTAVAVALASIASIEIVSADSRQVYRGLDIGTAKPTVAERAVAPHHLLDVIDPSERYSAGRFAREASDAILATAARGRLPLVVGGTGFYLKALFDGLFEEPPFEPARRSRLRAALGELPAAEQARWAERLDPGFAGGGSQRALRTIEIALLTGTALTRLHADAPVRAGPARAWYAVLSLPREALAGRIRDRVEAMLAAGLIAEVRRALEAGVPADAPGLSGVGYPEVIEHLEGRLPASGLAEAIAAATRRYAKRQETWFRNQLQGPVVVLDASVAPDVLAREVLTGYRAAVECA